MRITYLHQYFNTPDMAGGTRSYEMARRLVSRGHEVNMITSWREDDGQCDWFETEEAGIRVHWLPIPYSNRMGYWERIQAFFRFAWGAARRAASIPTDIVFATSTPLTIAIPASYAKWRQKVPMIFEVRDLWPDVPYAMGVIKSKLLFRAARCLERFSYSSANRIVVLTPTMQDFLSGKGVAIEKMVVIPNMANLSDFDSTTTNDTTAEHRSFKLLYCGGLGPAHGPEYLVRLASALKEKKAEVLIQVVGDGRMREELECEAKKMDCLDVNISFYGRISKATIPEFYRQADASIMTICDVRLLYRHSVQNKFFDSMAAGRPVFANYRGWASELAENEGAGWIVERYDLEQSASRIVEKLRNRRRMEKAQNAARKLAEDRFDSERLAGELESLMVATVDSPDKVDQGRRSQ